MDPFEAASQLSQTLRSLNPQIAQITKAAHFALRNSIHEDYLFPLIMDIFKDPEVELNQKNIVFQFIEVLVNESCTYSAQGKYAYPFVDAVRTHLPNIVALVVPHNANTNLYNVFSVLESLASLFKSDCLKYVKMFNSNLLEDSDFESIGNDIPYPEVELNELGDHDLMETAWKFLIQKKKQSQYEWQRQLKNGTSCENIIDEDEMFDLKSKTDTNNKMGLLKKQVLNRMEDDRESHKRLKELLWHVDRPKEISYLLEDEFFGYYYSKIHKLEDVQFEILLNNLKDCNETATRSFKDKQVIQEDAAQ